MWAPLLLLIALAVGGFFAVTAFKTRQQFYDILLPDALRLERETGIRHEITLAQAAHESGFGLTPAVQNFLAGSHNLFGIKPGSSWKGPTFATTTHETINGKYVEVPGAVFRAYPTYFASMQDWASLLVRLYPQAYQAAQKGDIKAFGEGLINGKFQYATDPKYPTVLARVYSAVQELA